MIISNVRVILILTAILSSNRMVAQLPPSSWLETAWNDSTFIKREIQAEFRARHPQTIPWLDKLELRTQTSDFNIKQQQYSLRFSPADPSEINYRKRMESTDVKLFRQLAADALHDALARRYLVLAEYYWIEKQANLFLEQQALHQKKSVYLESLFQHQLDAELKDLVQAYRKNEKIQLDYIALKDSRKLILQRSGLNDLSDSIVWNGFQWIQPTQIRNLLLIQTRTVPVSSSYARLIQNNSQLGLEAARLREDKWNILEFLQARWRNNLNDELIKEKISLGAGFRIPVPGNKRRDQNLLLMEKMQMDQEIAEYEAQYHQESQTMKQELESLLDQLEQQQHRLNQFKIKYQQPALLSNPLVKPQDILLIEETILDWKEEIIRIEKKLMDKYVEYLGHSRLISTPPYKNYLDANLEELTINTGNQD